MLKNQILKTLNENFNKKRVGLLQEDKFAYLNKDLPAGSVSQEFLLAHNIYADESMHQWAVNHQIVAHAERTGNKLVGVAGTKSNPTMNMHLFELTSFDRQFVRGANIKKNEMVFRYGTRTTLAGGILPFVKVNILRALVYFNASDEEESVRFESRGEKLSHARFTRDTLFSSAGLKVV